MPPPPPLAPFHARNPPRATDRAPARLLWLTDKLSLILMLVDTGASTSVFTWSRLSTGNLSASKHHLVGAGGARIDCYSSRMVTLQFPGKCFIWDFEVADVKKPIIGADLLTAYALVVDLQQGCLTSNGDQHLVLPCDLQVLISNGDFFINRIHRLL